MELYSNNPECIKYILNEYNKYITIEVIEKIFKRYDIKHKVKNLINFQTAMIHKSYLNSYIVNDKMLNILKELEPINKKLINKTIPLQENSYETLEFLGDAIIHAVLASYLYKRYTDKGPGFLTKLRTKLEEGDSLAKLARCIGLHEYAIIARNIEIAGGRKNNINIIEDIFEAFIGAMSLETNFEVCQEFIINIIDEEIDFAKMINTDNNYKELLMQYYHKIGYKTAPKYELIGMYNKTSPQTSTLQISDERIKQYFKMCVKNPDGKIVGYGSGISKLIAEKLAAKNALESLENKNINVNDNINNIKKDDDDVFCLLDE
jgi:dsRNA-specific ribonuclease